MPVLDYAALEIDAKVGSDGTEKTGRFEMIGGLNIEEAIRTGYLVEGAGSQLFALFADLFGDGEQRRKGVTLDAGGGQHVVEIQFANWTGAYHPETGDPLQWGATDDPNVTDATSATGADLVTQINVFMNYIRVAEIDSLSPARLEFGQYHTNGDIPELSDPLEVAIESPSFTRSTEEQAVFRGTITCIEVATLDAAWDIALNQG